MVESFWAVPDVTEIRTPLSILREQAAALTEQTKGTLVGIADVSSEGLGKLNVRLDVTVPSLNNYRYRILTYSQPVEMYPGTLWYRDHGREIADEQTFIAVVKEALSSERIRNVLGSLLSQATEA